MPSDQSANSKLHGLTSDEVLASRKTHGSNVLAPPAREPWWKHYLDKPHDHGKNGSNQENANDRVVELREILLPPRLAGGRREDVRAVRFAAGEHFFGSETV